jgi:hypothetical protein
MTNEKIKIHTSNNIIVGSDETKYYMNENMYELFFCKHYDYKYPIDIRNNHNIDIYKEVKNIPMRKIEMCKNANSNF